MPLDQIPLINGKAYAWGNVMLLLNGTPMISCTKIDYDDEQEKENGYGLGNMPTDRGDGNYKAAAAITVKAADAEALAAQVPDGRLQNFGVFEIIVSYLVGTTRVTHKLRNCEFTKNQRNLSQGDKMISVELPLIISHIDWK